MCTQHRISYCAILEASRIPWPQWLPGEIEECRSIQPIASTCSRYSAHAWSSWWYGTCLSLKTLRQSSAISAYTLYELFSIMRMSCNKDMHQSHRNMFLSCPTATMPCSFVISIVLTPIYNGRVWAHVLLRKSQNFMLPSFAQLIMISLESCKILVMWEECSVGRFRIKLPVLMSHIFIILSSPPLNTVQSSWSNKIVQMKSVWPVNVLRQAELYFLVKLQTLMVRSELPEIRVLPLLVHSIHNISLMCPEKFLTFSPFS